MKELHAQSLINDPRIIIPRPPGMDVQHHLRTAHGFHPDLRRRFFQDAAVMGQGIEDFVVRKLFIDPPALHAQDTVLAHVVIYRDARIGDNFFAHAHAVVREGCRLGKGERA